MNAGWYPDPERAHTQRYWDGAGWTDDRAPVITRQPGQAESTQTSGALDVLGIVMAIFLPIVGLLIGLALIGKSKASAAILVISVISFVVYFLVLTGH